MSRADRMRDTVGVLVLLAGAAIYVYAWLGMRSLAQHRIAIPTGVPAMRYFDTYWRMSRVAVGVVLVGSAIIAWSFWRRSRRRDGSV